MDMRKCLQDIYRKYIRCAKNARGDKDKNGRISDWQTIRKVNQMWLYMNIE